MSGDEICEECSRLVENTCDVCGEEFDNWSVSYTTLQCVTCGSVYQDEYKICYRCYEDSMNPVSKQ